LSGDVIFRIGSGRTDLPGGDMWALERSLARLLALPDDTTIYPGHGPTATVGYVRRYNPYMPSSED
jgi:glyoxylase-like metal-dependent hydrolase (beta-lactamase superfamily II)